jgi:hypothetical protein
MDEVGPVPGVASGVCRNLQNRRRQKVRNDHGSPAMTCYEPVTLLGTTLHRMRRADVLTACEESIRTRCPHLGGVANVAKPVNARRDPQLRQSLEEATFIVADGAPLVWLSRRLFSRGPGSGRARGDSRQPSGHPLGGAADTQEGELPAPVATALVRQATRSLRRTGGDRRTRSWSAAPEEGTFGTIPPV